MNKILKYLLKVWELPQNLLGAALKKIYKAEHYASYQDAEVYVWNNSGGLSLGKYIFIPFEKDTPLLYGVEQYIRHEYGHSVQSKILGWFYLLVIGLPSITWNGCFGWYRKKYNVSYYWFYTEAWADYLGGVDPR